MREINILGISLRDYTLREKLSLADRYLKNGALNTIECVSAKTLMAAGDDSQQRKWLEAMDMIVYGDVDIACSAGITNRNRLKEIENNSFLKELLRRLAREKYPVYLLTDSEDAMQMLENDLARLQTALQIVGQYVFSPDEEAADALINEINDKAPKVIIALSAYPVQESFIFQNKSRLNADIWLGLQKDSLVLGMEEKRISVLLRKLQHKIFQRKVSRYENQEKPEP